MSKEHVYANLKGTRNENDVVQLLPGVMMEVSLTKLVADSIAAKYKGKLSVKLIANHDEHQTRGAGR